jgi:starch synthase
MRILMVASEALPFAKTGGLADVLGSLPRALAKLGHAVDLVMPRYRGTEAGSPGGHIDVPFGGQVVNTPFHIVGHDGLRIVLVEHAGYFARDYLYGTCERDYADNAERFAFLSRAALGWAVSQPRYDVIHVHDWQTALVPVFLACDSPRYPSLREVPTVLTVHNLAYQGVFDSSWLPRIGLGGDLMRPDALEYWSRISFLKGGVNFSRTITTVSPRYAEEIQTPEYGYGFEGILRDRSSDLVGILNGIDYDQWDPARDPHLPEPYEASNMEGKRAAKRTLLETFGLPRTKAVMARPLVGLVSRMVAQKGFDLLEALANDLPRLDATFVLLGSGERRFEECWLGMAARDPDRVGARIGYDERLAHLIEAGADLFLMPSRFEPCGLNQMYSQRYGTLPLVRATGGLYDTVRNLDVSTGEGTGFMFNEYSPQAVLGTLQWALSIFQDSALWQRMQRAGMRQDFSWDHSAAEYVKVYEQTVP